MRQCQIAIKVSKCFPQVLTEYLCSCLQVNVCIAMSSGPHFEWHPSKWPGQKGLLEVLWPGIKESIPWGTDSAEARTLPCCDLGPDADSRCILGWAARAKG